MSESTSRVAPTPQTFAPEMSASAAASRLAATGTDAAPVVDSGGRGVGVFTTADHRSQAAPAARTDFVSDWQLIVPADRVRNHMTRRLSTTDPGAESRGLVHRPGATADPFRVDFARATD